LLVLAAIACASALAREPAALPEGFTAALVAARVPLGAVAVVVEPVGGGALAPLRVNASLPMNPASTMKLLTTFAALELLGPAYTWRTEAFAAGPMRGETLAGDLALRGSGDPRFVVEHLWLLVQRLRGLGLRRIDGDLLLDRSAFAVGASDPFAFDGEGLRPYNTGPDALLLNFKAVSLSFVPDAATRSVRVLALPPLAGLRLPQSLRAVDGACGDWRARLQADFSQPLAPQFRGVYPLACGERTWHLSKLEPVPYFDAVFRALWQSAGGTWSGHAREAPLPADARLLASHESEPLASVIRDINKFSNNVMARQLYLTLGAQAADEAGSPAAAERALRAWLAGRALEMPELVLENGAGLSRIERLSAASLARLLHLAFASPLMPEFVSSLPLAGVDGTMRRRETAVGHAHIKTGLLADVRAIAGYVHARSGQRYVVVSIVNHPNAREAQPAHDALLDWVQRHG
jgi:D-alanyl-D-alanine carboxypeptidase/D-alanyl-D-alanine-endopeptidase (penicillin-binding protein 4)